MILQGFRFGMLLQLSVGPICLLVFNTAGTSGLLPGLLLVSAIALVDAAYIALAGIGVASLLENRSLKRVIKLFGAAVLMLFGVNMLLAGFQHSLLPDLKLFSGGGSGHIFIQGLVLTASNPLTIIFWGGVFSAEAASKRLGRLQLFWFGLGCVLATVMFLSGIAVLGSMANTFLPEKAIQVLNAAVGLVLIAFGVKLLLKRDKEG